MFAADRFAFSFPIREEKRVDCLRRRRRYLFHRTGKCLPATPFCGAYQVRPHAAATGIDPKIDSRSRGHAKSPAREIISSAFLKRSPETKETLRKSAAWRLGTDRRENPRSRARTASGRRVKPGPGTSENGNPFRKNSRPFEPEIHENASPDRTSDSPTQSLKALHVSSLERRRRAGSIGRKKNIREKIRDSARARNPRKRIVDSNERFTNAVAEGIARFLARPKTKDGFDRPNPKK